MKAPDYPALVAKFIGKSVTPCKTPMLPLNVTERQFQIAKNLALGRKANGKPRKTKEAK